VTTKELKPDPEKVAIYTGSLGTIRCNCHSYRVQKQDDDTKIGRKSVTNAKVIMGVADSFEKAVILNITQGLATFRRRMDSDKIAELVGDGRINEAMEVIPWDKLEGDLEPVSGNLRAAMIQAGDTAINRLPAPDPDLRFDVANPAIARAIKQNTALLVQGISESTRQAVAQVMTRSFQQALTPKRAAVLIKRSVGLTGLMVDRVTNKRLREIKRRENLRTKLQRLKDLGKSNTVRAINITANLRNLTDKKIDARATRFADQLTKQRSVAIARTELTRSVNDAQLIVWDSAAERGLFNKNEAKKLWIAILDNKTSNICNGLDGQQVPLDDQFFVVETGAFVDAPPAHVNCRSALSLEVE